MRSFYFKNRSSPQLRHSGLFDSICLRCLISLFFYNDDQTSKFGLQQLQPSTCWRFRSRTIFFVFVGASILQFIIYLVYSVVGENVLFDLIFFRLRSSLQAMLGDSISMLLRIGSSKSQLRIYQFSLISSLTFLHFFSCVRFFL